MLLAPKMNKNRESVIFIRVSEKNKKRFKNFCQKQGIPESQMGWLFILRGIEDQNPNTVRGAINQTFGMDVGEMLKKYKYATGVEE